MSRLAMWMTCFCERTPSSQSSHILRAAVLTLFTAGALLVPGLFAPASAQDLRPTGGIVDCAGQPDGTPCDDGNCCTIGDACSGGSCVGMLLVCDDANPCTTDFCDPAMCVCVHVPIPGCTPCFAPDGTPCDDGSLCTTGDVCLGSVCTGASRACDDGNPCTTDTCNPANGWCVYAPGNAACSDGNPCTTDDHCGTVCGEYAEGCGIGSCVGGGYCDDCLCTEPCGPQPPGIPAGPSCDCCFSSSCGEVTPGCGPGRCQEGSYCDGCQCYSPESEISRACCSAAACVGTEPTDCRDDNICTVDSCDPTVPGGCVHVHDDQAMCDDNNPCTRDVCNPATGCEYYEIVPECDPCMICICDPTMGDVIIGCTSEPCDDQNAATTNDTCGGVPPYCLCQGTPIDCSDGNICTDDYWDVNVGGCVHVPNTLPCDDGLACTVNDTCTNGLCIGTHLPWDDGNPCTEDGCIPASGVYHLPLPDGTPCDDGDPCTVGDACLNVVCVGGPKCFDGKTCTDDVCAPVTGECSYPVDCPDGQACDANGDCARNRCWDAATRCDDHDACTADTCSPPSGRCDHTPICGTDAGIYSFTVPSSVKQGRTATIVIEEKNYGPRDATGSVTLYRDGVAVKVWANVAFRAGQLKTQSYGFSTSGYAGRTLSWQAEVSVPDDPEPSNNASAVRSMVVTK